MGWIRTRKQKDDAAREVIDTAARAVMEAEPAEVRKVVISLHVAGAGEQLSRVPIIGLEAGAIRGTIPHRQAMR